MNKLKMFRMNRRLIEDYEFFKMLSGSPKLKVTSTCQKKNDYHSMSGYWCTTNLFTTQKSYTRAVPNVKRTGFKNVPEELTSN